MHIVEFCLDANLLNLNLSLAQSALLKAVYGLPLSPEEESVFRNCVGRDYEAREYSDITVIAGARSGKDSRIAAPIAIYEALAQDHSYLAPGETGNVVIMAHDARGGQVAFGYVRGLLERSPVLRRSIAEICKDEIRLTNGIVISIYPCTYRAPRGVTIICAIADEVAFWRDQSSTNSDVEIIRSLSRGMANVPKAKLVKISTPYGRTGLIWDEFNRRDEFPERLVWKAPTWIMNPSIPDSFFAAERTKDRDAFEREYGAEFLEADLSLYASEVIDRAIGDELERPPCEQYEYFAAVDPSGGGPAAFTLAIGHIESADIVVDCIRGWRVDNPEQVIEAISSLLKAYGVSKVMGDRYSGVWIRDAFARRGITYEICDKNRSELYLEILPMFMQRRIKLPNHEVLIGELKSLRRRPSSSGRDSVAYPHGQHDDHANAVAVVVYYMSRDGSQRNSPIAVPSESTAPFRLLNNVEAAKFIECQRRSVLTHLLSDDE